MSDEPAARTALMWSGGKDAVLALAALQASTGYAVEALVTTVVEDAATVTMHGTPLALIQRQADALDLPLHVMRVPPEAANATYEARLERVLGPLLSQGCTTVAAGDIFLEDVRDYRAGALERIGARPVFPIWGRDTSELAASFLEQGYEAVVASVDTTQLDASFAGRTYDAAFLDALPESVDPCGEHGAFHTFVCGGPPLASVLPVRVAETHGEGRMRYARLELEP